MRIYDLDYCHPAAPELLVSGAESITLTVGATSSGTIQGHISPDGSYFDVRHDDKAVLFVKASGLNPDLNSASISLTNDKTVERGPNGRIIISKNSSTFIDIGNPSISVPLPFPL